MNSRSLENRYTFTCCDERLIDKIRNWLNFAAVDCEDLNRFLITMGVKLPANLKDSNDKFFYCISADGSEYKIYLSYMSFNSYDEPIVVIKKDNVETYTYRINYEGIPSLVLSSKSIILGTTSLFLFYRSTNLSYEVLFEHGYCLKCSISMDSSFLDLSVKNISIFEKYLLTLNPILTTAQMIYDVLIQIHSFNKNYLNNCTIAILKNNYIISKVHLAHGKIIEYTITKETGTYTVCKDNSWSYHSPKADVSFSLDKGTTFSIYGMDNILSANLPFEMQEICQEISSIKLLLE